MLYLLVWSTRLPKLANMNFNRFKNIQGAPKFQNGPRYPTCIDRGEAVRAFEELKNTQERNHHPPTLGGCGGLPISRVKSGSGQTCQIAVESVKGLLRRRMSRKRPSSVELAHRP